MTMDFCSDLGRTSRGAQLSAGCSGIFASKHRFSRSSSTRLLWIEQSPSNHVQVGQRRRDLEPVQILRQTPVADLAKAEDVLDHAEYMLDLGSHSRLVAVLRLLDLVDLPAKAIALVSEVLGSRCMPVNEVRMTLIPLVAPDPRLGAVQQVGQRVAVLHIGGRGKYRMDQLRFAVHSDVRLHAEI